MLAVAGLAWLVNTLIEMLSVFLARSQAAVKVEQEVRDILKEVWEQQMLLQQQAQARTERTSFAKAQARAMQAVEGAGSSDLDRLKHHLQVAHWGSRIAWDLVAEMHHRDALTAIYTRAWKDYLLTNKQVTTEQLQRLVHSAAQGGQRPSDLQEALLFDMATIYVQACRSDVAYQRALTAVPMLLDESMKSPEATGEELFSHWQLRADLERDAKQ